MPSQAIGETLPISISKRKVWLYVIIGLLITLSFAAISLLNPEPSGRYLTIPLALFGMVMAIWSLLTLKDKKPRLVISQEGLEDTRLPIKMIRWQDIDGVKVAEDRSGANRVGIRLKNPENYLAGLTGWQRFKLNPLSRLDKAHVLIDVTALDIDAYDLKGLIDEKSRRQ